MSRSACGAFPTTPRSPRHSPPAPGFSRLTCVPATAASRLPTARCRSPAWPSPTSCRKGRCWTRPRSRLVTLPSTMSAPESWKPTGLACLTSTSRPPATADAPALAAYRESALTLADEARRSGVRLGIEHFPGRGLPTVRETLDFIAACGHDNLYLLLDVGHNQIAGESVGESIRAAGDRLQYVHVNDNDRTQRPAPRPAGRRAK